MPFSDHDGKEVAARMRCPMCGHRGRTGREFSELAVPGPRLAYHCSRCGSDLIAQHGRLRTTLRWARPGELVAEDPQQPHPTAPSRW